MDTFLRTIGAGAAASAATAKVRGVRSLSAGALVHLGGILLFVPSLVLWLVVRRRPGFAAYEAKEALNWQITLGIALAALNLLALVVWAIELLVPVPLLAAITGLLPWVLYGVNVVLSVLGYLRARNRVGFRYPLALRLLR